jgi:hypothetical protein
LEACVRLAALLEGLSTCDDAIDNLQPLSSQIDPEVVIARAECILDAAARSALQVLEQALVAEIYGRARMDVTWQTATGS